VQLVGIDHDQGDPNSRVKGIEQVILIVNVIDITIVVVGPIRGPWLDKLEGITPVNNHRLRVVDDLFAPHTEAVARTELSPEAVVRNALSALRLHRATLIVLRLYWMPFLMLDLRSMLVLLLTGTSCLRLS
jgi:hypothetical protein